MNISNEIIVNMGNDSSSSNITDLNSTEITFSVNFMCVILIAMDVLTLIGNSTVIMAILTVPRLQTITNYFILSLGFADFLVGLFVLPAAISLHMTEGVWVLGWILCDAWISMDILLCTASILSLCAISIDRYLAISQPFRYSKRLRTKGLVMKIIAAVWILSAVITCPPMLGWSEPNRHGPNLTECHYNEKPGYIVYSACGTFYVPLIVILYTYGRIVVVVKERTKYFVDMQGGTEGRQTSNQPQSIKRSSSTKESNNDDKVLKLSEVIVSPYLKVHFIDLSSSAEGSSTSSASSNNSSNTSSIDTKRKNNLLQPPPSNEHELRNKCMNCGASCHSRLHISYVNDEESKKPGGLNFSSFRRSLRRGVKNNLSNNSATNSFNHHLREAKTAKRLAVVLTDSHGWVGLIQLSIQYCMQHQIRHLEKPLMLFVLEKTMELYPIYKYVQKDIEAVRIMRYV
ncbi:TyrR [Lepeophtheirus salmonis]|uniref:TyrR n=1 Tax=Lepeophtheirus salmonis TaxID=72036 RepID=A0A7R8HD02_LEPSM|nr:TyrR [Lepeophtheirus salmonis]CAF3013523.1 TyrR [Lepeophtheirus salmonis]